MTTKDDIKQWLAIKITPKWYEFPDRPITHMIVACDTFDYEDYPVYVSDNESIHDVIKQYDGKNMQKVMEVYSYKMDFEKQLEQDRCWNID